jgi:hypothetical protein
VNHMFKAVVLSGALALCAMVSGWTPSEAETSAAVTAASGNVCDQFCQSQGGPHYLLDFATSETQCNQKGGDWYTADQGYPGPPPGCCCKCASPGCCL